MSRTLMMIGLVAGGFWGAVKISSLVLDSFNKSPFAPIYWSIHLLAFVILPSIITPFRAYSSFIILTLAIASLCPTKLA